MKLAELIDIGAQVASGMAYLESQHCIHRDLCARNVQIGNGIIVKIGGFGLARLLVNGEYLLNEVEYLQVKWTAPEVFINFQFTIKSDIWSFGVFLTELVTHGCDPYPGMTNDEVIEQIEQLGCPMPPPPGCPDNLYQMMLECWKANPTERPTFDYVKHKLHSLLGKLHSYMVVSYMS